MRMLKLENCPDTRPEWFWLKCILSCMLQRLKILPLNAFFFLLSSLHLVRASEALDPASKLVKILCVAGSFGLCSVKEESENPAFSSWRIWWLKVWCSGVGFLLNIGGNMLQSAQWTTRLVKWDFHGLAVLIPSWSKLVCSSTLV